MYGFFTWESPPHDSPAQTAQCPNCGSYVQRDSLAEHECSDAAIEEHHVRLLASEFWALFGTNRNRGPENDLHLLHWRPFSNWLRTPHGKFAEHDAERLRP